MQFRTRKLRTLVLATVFAAPFAWAPLVSADLGGEAPAVDVSDAEIAAFASAMGEVQQIGQEWTQRMQEAEGEQEVAEMRQQAQEEMVGAIESEGLSVEEYNEIATAAQQDQELAQRIQQEAGMQ